jgi:hypothetical protein
MSRQDLVNAALLQLRAKVHESYAILESAVNAAPTENSTDAIATAAVRLSQWEHATLALQRQIENLLAATPEEEPTPVEVEEVDDEEVDDEEPPQSRVVNADNSPTFRRFQKYRNTSTQEDDES